MEYSPNTIHHHSVLDYLLWEVNEISLRPWIIKEGFILDFCCNYLSINGVYIYHGLFVSDLDFITK